MRYFVSILMLLALVPPATHATQPDRDESLIIALRALNTRVAQPLPEDRIDQQVYDGISWMGQGAGAAAIMMYASSLVPNPALRAFGMSQGLQYAFIFGRVALWTMVAGAGARAAIWVGGRAYRAYRAPSLSQDPREYKSKEGLVDFFQLPIDKQYLIAIEDRELGDYILELHHALEILNFGFDTPQANGSIP